MQRNGRVSRVIWVPDTREVQVEEEPPEERSIGGATTAGQFVFSTCANSGPISVKLIIQGSIEIAT